MSTSTITAAIRGFLHRHRIFQRLQNPEHELWASAFNLSELLVAPIRTNDEFRIEYLDNLFCSSRMNIQSYTLSAAKTFAYLRGHDRVKPTDALHLSCAAAAGVDLFVTNDTALTRLNIPGIGSVIGLDASF